jgi:hypothetical protein
MVEVNVKLQPVVVVDAATPATAVISPDDLTYSSALANSFDPDGGDYHCSPCKEIFVSSLGSNARLRLSWTGPVALDLWAGVTCWFCGLQEHRHGISAQQELTMDVAGRQSYTVLVGLDGAEILEPIAFRLAVEPTP